MEALIFVAGSIAVYILIVVSRRSALKRDERRSDQLHNIARGRWPGLDRVTAFDLLYKETYKKMVEKRNRGENYEPLLKDSILIFNMRNEFIADEAERSSSFRQITVTQGR